MTLSSTDVRQVRTFGIVGTFFFGGMLALSVWRGKTTLEVLFTILSTVAILHLLFPVLLRPVYNRWLKITRGISKIITGIILSILYYIIITPVARYLSIVNKTPLRMHPDKTMNTYWKDRDATLQAADRFFKRY